MKKPLSPTKPTAPLQDEMIDGVPVDQISEMTVTVRLIGADAQRFGKYLLRRRAQGASRMPKKATIAYDLLMTGLHHNAAP